MGYTIIKEYTRFPISDEDKVFEKMMTHPNFSFPDKQKLDSVHQIIDYVINSSANFISPPKVADEDDEFKCEDVAAVLKGDFKRQVKKNVIRLLEKSDKLRIIDNELIKNRKVEI